MLQLTIKPKDINNQTNGPNNQGCGNNGKPADDTIAPFDGDFTCSCSGDYTGDNCEVAPSTTTNGDGADSDAGAIAGGLTAVIVALLVVAAVLKYKERKEKLKSHDFLATIQSMLADGDLDQAHADAQMVPREIKRAHITLHKTLGQGAFGEVKKGEIDESSAGGAPGYPCAVKTVKAGSAEGMADLLQEATVMAQVGSHPYIVSMIGVVTSGEPAMLVISLCEHGSLKDVLLKAHDDDVPVEPSVKNRICVEIAEGMAYLHSKRFVHRDLAARNVLMASGMTAKVADFGLSRAMAGAGAGGEDNGDGDGDGGADYYRSHRGVFPVRWTAIEAMETLVFNAATDVWSFGIVMDEVWWDAQLKPYGLMKNKQVKDMLTQGGRLAKPANASDGIYQIMRACWKADPTKRPSFAQLAGLLRPHTNQGTGSDENSGGVRVAAALAGSVDETSFDYLQPIAVTVAGAGSGALGSVANIAAADDGGGEDYDMPTGSNIELMVNAGGSPGTHYDLAAPTITSEVGASYMQVAATVSTPTSRVLGPGPEYELEAGPEYELEAGPEYEIEVVRADELDEEGYQRPAASSSASGGGGGSGSAGGGGGGGSGTARASTLAAAAASTFMLDLDQSESSTDTMPFFSI